MKRTVLLAGAILIYILLCTGCNDEMVDYYNPDVKLFVKHLKAGTYNTTNEDGIVDIPLFAQQHIPELLRYSEDITEIPSFPMSSINSQFGGKPRLGECMLWIIEGIRLGYPASFGCKLLHRDADSYDGIYFLTNEQVIEVAVLYRKWWQKVENPNLVWSMELLMYDPLQGSNYRWW